MTENSAVQKLSHLLCGGRIRATQINLSTQTTRFDRRVERVEMSQEEGFIEIWLTKEVPKEYGLTKGRIIYFCLATKTYRGIFDNPHRQQEHHIFKVEIVGLRYSRYIKELEGFGISISGHNIRVIMFEKLFEKFGPPVVFPEHGKRIMETFGAELRARAADFLQDKRFSLTDEERYVIEKYLSVS